MPGLGNRPGGDGLRPSQRPTRPTSPQDRRDNLQDRLSSREDFRDRNREDWQDRRDEIREDWQDRYDDFYDRHEDWHHGCGDYGGWWDHMWDDHTALMAFGVTMWGLNWAGYGSGYWGYDNPYYTESYPVGGDVVIDYSQPLAVESADVSGSAVPTEAAAPGMADFDVARQSFYQGDYAAALASANKALSVLPNDPIVHEFRALVLFAQGKYRDAAAGLYSVLSVGPGWDWTTLSSLYPTVDSYTQQLRALEANVRQNPDATDARFVLAYHYLTMGSKTAATNQLKKLYAQQPQDRLIKELLMMTGGAEAVGAEPAASQPAESEAPAVPATDLVGKWTATGEGKSTFAMDLTKDGNFSWKYTQNGKSQEVKGVFAVDGNVLAMEPESGGQMLAEVTPPKGGSFKFKLLGAPPGDEGLKFAKAR